MSSHTIRPDATAEELLEAQSKRLRAVASVLAGRVFEPLDDVIDDTIRSLSFVVARIHDNRDDEELWLVYTAMCGTFPSDHDIEAAAQFRDNNNRDAFFDWLIPATAATAVWGGSSALGMRIIADRPIVDVNACARYNRHTGIQRVERETIPLWAQTHEFELVAWTERSSGYRSLTGKEIDRVLRWGKDPSPIDGAHELELVVPWRTTIMLPEVTDRRQSSRLLAMAKRSGSRVVAIGYDVIPLTSPELLPADHGTDFIEYLNMMQSAAVIAGISHSATEEFRGYIEATGRDAPNSPKILPCELPTAVPDSVRVVAATPRDVPVILCVGSHEPRKNHVAVLFAAEKLWREGLDFEVWFFGGGGWGTDFDEQAERLRKRGRKVTLKKAVTDAVLWEAYRDARFTVFPSLHEGFGLPAAESLSFGTPVITTNYGSTREIAERGGSIMVDPRSDAEIHDAMKLLLTNDEVYNRLATEASSIPVRTWAEYADELWTMMMDENVSV